MMTITMIFLFPIGLAFYLYERKHMVQYQATFDNYIDNINKNKTINANEKCQKIRLMLEKNSYHISRIENGIKGEKKIFFAGILMMGMGAGGVGAIIYMVYYFFFKKPHTIRYDCSASSST